MATKRRHQNAATENGRAKHSLQSNSKSKSSKRKDKENGHYKGDVTRKDQGTGWSYAALVGALAIMCAFLHRNHIAGMFESDRHFSHLSTLEREFAFRTEMGLYYSYYKTIIEADSFTNGVHAIMYDNITEYPLTINTLKRFNLYPEVTLGLGYRLYEGLMGWFNIRTKVCWQVNRGQGLSPVQSCEGLGEPSYFYIESVFLLNGLNMAIFFLFGTYLSGSIFGGALTVMTFFYNHGECTRVQWTPPLRESFAYPFLVIQMFLVTRVLRMERPTYFHSLLIGVATVCFMLPWQFAQFALMTQTVAVFATYVLMFIGSHKMKIYLLGQAIGLCISYVCLFGNEMLLTSFYASCLISVAVITFLEPLIEKIPIRFFIWVVQGVLWVFGTLSIKILSAKVLQVADDAHIGDIFRSKFTNFKNFHTMLYTCAAEFDFMEKETPWRLLKTLLGPAAVVAVSVVVYKILHHEYTAWRAEREVEVGQIDSSPTHSVSESEDLEDSRKHRSKPNAEIVYHLFQLLAYTAMAVIIMRLKLFWTPHLCLITSLLASEQFFGWLGKRQHHLATLGVIMAVMSVGGVMNLQHQWSIIGEFSNMPMEQMIEWINANTPSNAVFAGPMPTMATVKLSTGRPIVNHPHYEDVGLRERTKKVYSMYSRKPLDEVWQNLMDLQVDYALLEQSWCVRRSKLGCGMAEIWDIEDEANKDKVPICFEMKKTVSPYFKRVFRNDVYDILQIVKNPSSGGKNGKS